MNLETAIFRGLEIIYNADLEPKISLFDANYLCQLCFDYVINNPNLNIKISNELNPQDTQNFINRYCYPKKSSALKYEQLEDGNIVFTPNDDDILQYYVNNQYVVTNDDINILFAPEIVVPFREYMIERSESQNG